MNVVVFGEDIYTAAVTGSLINSGHQVLLIITPDNFNESHKVLEDAASRYNIEFVKDKNINSEKIKDYLIKVKPDVIVAAHLRKILHKEIFSLATKGAINIHPSLLPKYRGLSPQHQAILHGDNDSGVTVHYIDADVDTGEIIVQERFSVAADDYIVHVQTKMLDIYKRIVVKALDLLADATFKPAKQDLAEISYFGPLKKADREIDLSKSKKEVYNLVRAVSLPYKGAFYKNYTIWAAAFPGAEKEAALKSKYAGMGFYFDTAADEIIIRLKDGFLVSDDFEVN